MTNKVLTVFAIAFTITSVFSSNYYDYVGKRILTASEVENEELKNISSECSAQWKVKPIELQRVEMGLFPNNHTGLKCYYSCYFQKYGTMASNGTFNLKKLEEKFSPFLYKSASFCVDSAMTVEPCEKAFEVYTCFVNKVNIQAEPTL